MESKIFDGPVWIQAQQIIRYFEDTLHTTYTVRDPVTNAAHKVDNWPSAMFAELATNCILHKDYSRKQHIEIAAYRDRISFINHNRPLPPVTIEDLNEQTVFDDRQYVNDELKDMFFKLDLIQSYGSGIRRAKNAMAVNGSPKLVFSPNNDTDDYTLAVAYINEEFARIQEESSQAENQTDNNKSGSQSVNPRNERSLKEVLKEAEYHRVEIIADIIDKQGFITPSEAQSACGKSESTTWRYIKMLINMGFIISEGSTNNVVYKRKHTE